MARYISCIFLALALGAAAQTPGMPPAKGTPPPAETRREFPIDSIAVEGNRILTAAGIIAASGLKVGEKGDTPVFDAARDRLLATGYFETLAYRFKSSEKGGGYDLVFEVREMQPLYNLKVESLPATVQDLTVWLREKDPLFSGRIPGTQQVLDRTAREIEAYFAAKNEPRAVAGRIVLVSPQHYEAQFNPAEGLPNVALVAFEGNKAIRTPDLQNGIASVAFGLPYTEANFRLLLENQLKPLYEKEGYMRVEFGKITTSPSTTVKGVDVKVVLTEGPRFKLGEVGVRGPMEDQSKHILRVAKLPKMAVVNFDEVRQAEIRINDSLRQEGYLDVVVTTDREIDDEKKTVDVWFVPQPGPQYMFGKLEIKGLGLDGAAAMEKAWTLKKGEPYAGDYPDFFLKRVKEEGYFDNLGETRAEPQIDAATHVVDVTLYFRYDPDAKKKRRPQPGDPPDGQGPYPGRPLR